MLLKLPYINDIFVKFSRKNLFQMRIAGGEVKTRTDYPTMDDIKSDWGSVDEKELLAEMKQTKKPNASGEKHIKEKPKGKKLKESKKKPLHNIQKSK